MTGRRATPWTPPAVATLVPAGALLLGTVFFGGDSRDTSVPWVGGAAALLAAGALAARSLGLVDLPRLDRAGRLAAGALVGLVAWAAISIVWSVAGDRSWTVVNKGIAYAAFLAVGLLLCCLRTHTTRTVAGLLASVLGLALAWALLGKAVPSLGPTAVDSIARLQDPVGYANGLALLADAALVLGLWLATAVPARRAVRAAGALLVYVAVLALLLTSSRSGELGAVLALALWLWLGGERVRSGLAALAAGVPATAVAGWAFTRPALVDTGASHAARVHDGVIFGGLAVVGAAVAVTAASTLPARLLAGRERQVAGVLAGIAALGVVGLLAAVAVKGVHGVSQGECTNAPGRASSLCLNNRLHWWDEALRVFAARPLGGSGAGTFEIARTRYRRDGVPVTQPHSVPLQVLSDTGLVGGALLLVLAGAAAVGIRWTLRLLDGPERAAAVALAALPAAYALHTLVDYDLDFVALSGPTVLVTGTLLGAGRPLGRGGGSLPALATAGAALVVLLSLFSPWLSSRRVDSAYVAFDAGRLGPAISDARSARALDPLAVDPILALAQFEAGSGDNGRALAYYLLATRKQPENPDTWYLLGLFEQLEGDQCAAYKALNHSYTLDQRNTHWTKGGPLDRARAAVDDPKHPACGR